MEIVTLSPNIRSNVPYYYLILLDGEIMVKLFVDSSMIIWDQLQGDTMATVH